MKTSAYPLRLSGTRLPAEWNSEDWTPCRKPKGEGPLLQWFSQGFNSLEASRLKLLLYNQEIPANVERFYKEEISSRSGNMNVHSHPMFNLSPEDYTMRVSIKALICILHPTNRMQILFLIVCSNCLASIFYCSRDHFLTSDHCPSQEGYKKEIESIPIVGISRNG